MKVPCIPHAMRWVGFVLLVPGIVLGYFWGFAGFNPEWMSIPVFAAYSSYIKTVVFGMSRTNITDELAGVLLLGGLLWLVCSKEKQENGFTDILRYKALFFSVLVNSVFLFLSILFVFGMGFINVMILNLFSQMLFYLIIFRVLILRQKGKPDG